MLPWMYKNEPLIEVPEGYKGFVYRISLIDTGEYYIGQKRFHSRKKKKPLKGKKRNRISFDESNWKEYCSSSELVKIYIEENGPMSVKRDVIRLCRSFGGLNFFETEQQILNRVLTDEKSLNSIINCRIHRSHLNKEDMD